MAVRKKGSGISTENLVRGIKELWHSKTIFKVVLAGLPVMLIIGIVQLVRTFSMYAH